MISKEQILRRITPKNDIVFKKIFGSKGNEGILKSFLESILEINIEALSLDLSTELIPDFYDGKLSRLDVLTRLEDQTIVNIEIQTSMQDYSDKRELAYWSRLYLKQFKQGDDYKRADKTICIWILDGEVYDFPEYHSIWKITEKKNGLTKNFDDFEIHAIELKKFRELDIMEPKKKEFWLWFIDHTKKELVDMSSYSLEEIRKAKAEYEKMIEDNDAVQYLLIKEEMDAMDRAHRDNIAKEKGLEEGRREGHAEGRAEGLAEGEKKTKIETAKKMLELGIEIAVICQITGLSNEEIEDLKK